MSWFFFGFGLDYFGKGPEDHPLIHVYFSSNLSISAFSPFSSFIFGLSLPLGYNEKTVIAGISTYFGVRNGVCFKSIYTTYP
jgi:hypothetical protein